MKPLPRHSPRPSQPLELNPLALVVFLEGAAARNRAALEAPASFPESLRARPDDPQVDSPTS